MAEATNATTLAPLTEEALLADRQAFWTSFTSVGLYASIAIILLVVMMWIFLV